MAPLWWLPLGLRQRSRVPRATPQADDDAPKKGKEKRSWDEGESKKASTGKGKVELNFLPLTLTLTLTLT